MRALVGFIVALACLYPGMANAAKKNPFELKATKDNKGMIIVEIDDSPVQSADILAGHLPIVPPLPFSLGVTWFDAERKKPHVELHWVSTPNTADFQEVADDEGHRYLIGAIGESEALIASFYVQDKWGSCYNAETYHFFVKGGAYTFIGRFNPYPSYKRIIAAVQSGQMPRSVSQNSAIPPLTEQILTPDFVAATDLPDDKARIETLLMQKLGKPIALQTAALHKTDYNLAKNGFLQTSCMFWSSGGDMKAEPAASVSSSSSNTPSGN